MDTPGFLIQCPAATPPGRIQVHVEMGADARTYWDTDGILDKALTVALIRRDRPGLRFLAKIDPSALMLPDEPLPDRPSDEALAQNPSVITEQKALEVPEHRGAARYFVMGAFARHWQGPESLEIVDASRTAPSVTQPLSVRTWTRPATIPAAAGVALMAARQNGRTGLQVEYRAAVKPEHVLTVFGVHLTSKGGATGGVFELAPYTGGAEPAALGFISMARLAPAVGPGSWRFWAFVGDWVSPALEVDLEAHDLA